MLTISWGREGGREREGGGGGGRGGGREGEGRGRGGGREGEGGRGSGGIRTHKRYEVFPKPNPGVLTSYYSFI